MWFYGRFVDVHPYDIKKEICQRSNSLRHFARVDVLILFPCHHYTQDHHYWHRWNTAKPVKNIQKLCNFFWSVAPLVREGDLIAAIAGGYYWPACNCPTGQGGAQRFWPRLILFISRIHTIFIKMYFLTSKFVKIFSMSLYWFSTLRLQ